MKWDNILTKRYLAFPKNPEPQQWGQMVSSLQSMMNTAKEVISNSANSANGVVGSVSGNFVDTANTAVNMATNTVNSGTGVVQEVAGGAAHTLNGPVVGTLNDTINQASNVLNINNTKTKH